MPVGEGRQKQERGEPTDHGNPAGDHRAKDAVSVSDGGQRPKEQGNESKGRRDTSEGLPELESIIELVDG